MSEYVNKPIRKKVYLSDEERLANAEALAQKEAAFAAEKEAASAERKNKEEIDRLTANKMELDKAQLMAQQSNDIFGDDSDEEEGDEEDDFDDSADSADSADSVNNKADEIKAEILRAAIEKYHIDRKLPESAEEEDIADNDLVLAKFKDEIFKLKKRVKKGTTDDEFAIMVTNFVKRWKQKQNKMDSTEIKLLLGIKMKSECVGLDENVCELNNNCRKHALKDRQGNFKKMVCRKRAAKRASSSSSSSSSKRRISHCVGLADDDCEIDNDCYLKNRKDENGNIIKRVCRKKKTRKASNVENRKKSNCVGLQVSEGENDECRSNNECTRYNFKNKAGIASLKCRKKSKRLPRANVSGEKHASYSVCPSLKVDLSQEHDACTLNQDPACYRFNVKDAAKNVLRTTCRKKKTRKPKRKSPTNANASPPHAAASPPHAAVSPPHAVAAEGGALKTQWKDLNAKEVAFLMRYTESNDEIDALERLKNLQAGQDESAEDFRIIQNMVPRFMHENDELIEIQEAKREIEDRLKNL